MTRHHWYTVLPSKQTTCSSSRVAVRWCTTVVEVSWFVQTPWKNNAETRERHPERYTVSCNDTHLVCYNLDIRDPILVICDSCVTEKICNQIYFPASSNLTSAYAVRGKTRKHQNCIFYSNAALLLCQSLLNLFNVGDLWPILTPLYDSLNLTNQLGLASGCWGQ